MPKPALRILGVGHVALDHQFTIARFPPRPTKTPAETYRAGVGGMTANACVAASRLGAAVRIASPMGDDAGAALALEHFEREGVDAGGLARVAGARSSVSAVIIDAQGERLIVNHRGDALQRAGAFEASQVDAVQVLLTDPRCPHWARAALLRARSRGVLSILDGDTAPQQDLQDLVGLSDWAVFSEPGLAAFCPGPVAPALAAALDAGAEVAVLTQGEHGVQWQRRGRGLQHLAAFAVSPVVDTTAAGDTFHGALAVALGEGEADADALRFASAAAALKCLRPAGVLGAPSRAEVARFLQGAP